MAQPVSKEQLIGLLNEDLKLEYAAALQYVQHASVIEGPAYDYIRSHLLDHAREEIEHAVKIADRINYLGGTPIAESGLAKVSKDPRYMLALNLGDERNAIARYKERIEQAVSLREYGLVELLQGILLEEEEHENDLISALGTGIAVGQATPAQVAESFAKLASMEQERKSR